MDLTVTIVRHGNTFERDAPPRRIGARTDLPLVTSGREQAAALGAAFAISGRAFDQAITAPLARSRETIDLILAAQSHRPALSSADWLTEIDHGPDENQLESAVVARIGQAALSEWDRDARPPDGWVVDSERRMESWRDLWRDGQGDMLIVTSNGAARFALLSDAGLHMQALALPSLKLRTGAYGVVVRERGHLRLIEWDRRP
jgi:probable phosphoglycerate mutase